MTKLKFYVIVLFFGTSPVIIKLFVGDYESDIVCIVWERSGEVAFLSSDFLCTGPWISYFKLHGWRPLYDDNVQRYLRA